MREDLPEQPKGVEREFQAGGNEGTYRSVAALATDLGLSERSTRSALRRGEIPHIRVGRRFILPRAAIAEWLRTAGLGGIIQSAVPASERPALVASSGHSEVTVMRPAKLAGRT
jgi:excisionase family DNA binding protein